MTTGNYIKEAFAPVHLTNTVTGKVNSFSLTVEPTNDSKAIFTVYGNGDCFGSQTLLVDKVEALHQFCSSSDFRLYATRIYERPLTAEEAAQNHFADIAIQNRLDIGAFLLLDDEGKRDVYDAFDCGELFLTITVGESSYNAHITRTDEYDIFTIQQIMNLWGSVLN